MPFGKCPKCGNENVRYSSSATRSIARALRHSVKRWCPACGEKWSEPHLGYAVKYPWKEDMRFSLVLGMVIGLLAVLLAQTAFHPVDWFKTLVRASYDRKYGKDSGKMLWEHYGVLYNGKDGAKADYATHGKKP